MGFHCFFKWSEVSNISFPDLDLDESDLGGTLSWTPPVDESQVEHYVAWRLSKRQHWRFDKGFWCYWRVAKCCKNMQQPMRLMRLLTFCEVLPLSNEALKI